jgi:release factor glutamine methyltransferase
VGTDISPAAVAVARANAARLDARVEFAACDVLSALAGRSMDAVLCNPPYVPLSEEPHIQREVRDYEPRMAVFSGPTGFEMYERLVEESLRVLRPGGHIILELGFGSRDRVLAMLDSSWGETQVIPDLAGIPRVLVSRLL